MPWKNLPRNMVGKRFGRLTVIAPDVRKNPGRRERVWLCRCDCGKETTVPTSHLNNGNTRSCGCLQNERVYPNLVGQKFGRLTVIESAGKRKHHAAWLCKCDCGNERVVVTCYLRNGSVRSCGCLRIELFGRPYRLPSGEASRNRVIDGYRRNAKTYGLSFDLTKEEASELLASNCHYCGCAPSQIARSHNTGEFRYNGIDRIDNALGYTRDNVFPCCKVCNTRKGASSYADFIAWIRAVAINLNLTEKPNQ